MIETGLLHKYFGNFPREMKDIIFLWGGGGGRGACEVRLNLCKVRLKQTSENLETQKNSNFLFGWRGTFGDDIWWGGVGWGPGG